MKSEPLWRPFKLGQDPFEMLYKVNVEERVNNMDALARVFSNRLLLFLVNAFNVT